MRRAKKLRALVVIVGSLLHSTDTSPQGNEKESLWETTFFKFLKVDQLVTVDQTLHLLPVEEVDHKSAVYIQVFAAMNASHKFGVVSVPCRVTFKPPGRRTRRISLESASSSAVVSAM